MLNAEFNLSVAVGVVEATSQNLQRRSQPHVAATAYSGTPNLNSLGFSRGTRGALREDMGKERDLRKRTMNFALAVSDVCERLPNTFKGRHVFGQLFRAGTAVAANYRAACRGKSKPDFIAKLGTVIEEADESGFWLEFSVASRLPQPETARALRIESGELVAIFTQSVITARESLEKPSP